MNIDAKYHPTPEQLEGFAQGTLSPGMNVVISAHVELCAICRKSVSELEEAASEEWLRSTPDRRASSCLLYTSPSPRDTLLSRMPSSA